MQDQLMPPPGLKTLHTLAIDDHAVILEGYHFMFQNLNHNFSDLKFTKAHDCMSGAIAIDANKNDPFDIALIDYSIPHYTDKKLNSGEDVALLVRQTMPNCKIIMMTMHCEIGIISSILQRVMPEGFINKSDCTTDELIHGFKDVLDGNTFYSKTISGYIEHKQKGIILEEIDIRMLLLLAKGIKNKNLYSYIPLSESTIEKRKYKIKRLLEVDGGDEELIKQARLQGYI